jgi:hypothetical protein
VALQLERAADHLGVRRKLTTPELVADDSHRTRVARAFVVVREEAAELWP